MDMIDHDLQLSSYESEQARIPVDFLCHAVACHQSSVDEANPLCCSSLTCYCCLVADPALSAMGGY